MSSQPWNEEMSHLLFKIERETESSICKLKKSLKRCGLTFDRKFRKYFLRATDNRLTETFDRFEIDSLAQSSSRHDVPAADNRFDFMNRTRRPVDQSPGPSTDNGHLYEIDNQSHSHAQHRKSLNSKKSSVKDRLGAKVVKHTPPIKQRKNLKKSVQKQRNTSRDDVIEDVVVEQHPNDNSQQMSIVEEPMDVGGLELILNKFISKPTKETSIVNITFCCIYCHDNCIDTTSKSIEDVYAHWLSGHTDMPNVKPFGFFIMDQNSACFYCDKIGTLHQLIQHEKDNHRNRSIAILNPENRKQCAFCDYAGASWSDHFDINHKMLLQSHHPSPISLTNETLCALLSIDIHKRRQCAVCDETFETEHQVECHTLTEHPREKILSKIVHDSQKMYLVCDVCTEQIDPDVYLNHLEEHTYEFKCRKCDFNTQDLIDLAFHENHNHHANSLNYHYLQFSERLKVHFFRTKVVFGNGLILNKHQLLGTDYDDYSQFRYMVETMIDIKVKKYGWLVQKQNNNQIDEKPSDDDDACSVSTDEFILSTMASSTAFNESSKPPPKHPNPHSSYLRELEQQHRLVKNVCIHGVPRRRNENLREIIRRICVQLGANISSNEIGVVHRISKSDPLIIVKFTNIAAKQRIMISRRSHDILTSDVIDMPVGVMPAKIHIFSHLTDFFEELRKIAKLAVQDQRLFSYCLTKHGFLVKRTRDSSEKYIFSRNELRSFIGYSIQDCSQSRSSDGF